MKKKRPGKERKTSKKQSYLIFMGALIILIMVGGAINMGGEDENAVEFNGVQFVQTSSGWVGYKEDGSQIAVSYNPEELKNMTIGYVPISQLNMMGKIYLTYNPQERVRSALTSFAREIELNPLIIPACTEDVPQCADMPLKTCDDATESIGVIEFRETNETFVGMDGNCLKIHGRKLDKLVDRLILEQI